jgi:oligosaccharyltransferase complex subunit alpha (ribophorin I)
MKIDILCVFALSLLSASLAAVVNEEVTRTVDASTAIVKVTTDIKVEGSGKEYPFYVPNSQASHVAFISAAAKGKKGKVKGQGYKVSAPVIDGDEKGYTKYTIFVGESSPTIRVKMILTDLLVPYPAEISQSDNQFVRFVDSHYFYSPYSTTTQKLVVKLASSTVESYTKHAPHVQKGSTLTFGPYKEIEPYSVSPLTVHYLNNKPFSKLTTTEIDIEVSHWGESSVEEIHELKHTGARLSGGFSRLDYQMKQQASTPSFNSLVAHLPTQAHSIYYRDQIGNISTSDMRLVDNGLELDIATRFPIFGGWKTQFYLGYSIPTANILSVDSDTGRYKVKFDLFPVFEDVWVGALTLKLALPEGASDVKVHLPEGAGEWEQSWSRRFTYLDSKLNGGRPVLILKGHNLVEDLESVAEITYTFNKARMLVEPFMLFLSFFALFALATIVSQMSAVGASEVSTSGGDDDKEGK